MAERYSTLAALIAAVRAEEGITQSAAARQTGLGRSVVAERVSELERAGLLRSLGLAPSTGGRAAHRLALNSAVGLVIGIDFFSWGIVVGTADLSGTIIKVGEITTEPAAEPEHLLSTVDRIISDHLAELSNAGVLLGIGVGLPGPVNFDTGTPIATPVVDGWAGYPVRAWLQERWEVPVWVDNRTNLLALAELRANPAASRSGNVLYFGATNDVAAALVVEGRIHRGTHGLAGSIGHVRAADSRDVACRCGRTGCLEALVGGWALARDGAALADAGASPLLRQIGEQSGRIRPLDITAAANDGDAAARALMTQALEHIGHSLAPMIALFAPEVVIIGGGLTAAGDWVLEPIRAAVASRTLSGSTADCVLELSVVNGPHGAMTGATQLALDQLLSRDGLRELLQRLSADRG